MSPFWRCAVLVPELLVYWAEVPVCSAGGQEPGNSLTNTLHWSNARGRHLPDYKLQTSYKSRAIVSFFSSLMYILYYDLHFNISRQPVAGLSSISINPRQCKGGQGLDAD